MTDDLEDRFNQAAAKVSSGAVGNLSQEEQLAFYGLYSIVRKGPAPSEAPSAIFDPRGYAKWSSWKEVGEMGRKEAMSKYVQLVDSIPSDRQGERSETSTTGLGSKALSGFDISHSEVAAEEVLDICHWAAKGDVTAVLNCLEKLRISPNYRDQDNLTPLMRAADRNEEQVADVLVEAGADLNAVDDEGQSALHYAVYCEHVEMAALLVAYGASTEISDADGLTPIQAANPSLIAAFDAVKAGTWQRTSGRYKRQVRRRMADFSKMSAVSSGTIAAIVVGIFAAIVIPYLRKS